MLSPVSVVLDNVGRRVYSNKSKILLIILDRWHREASHRRGIFSYLSILQDTFLTRFSHSFKNIMSWCEDSPFPFFFLPRETECYLEDLEVFTGKVRYIIGVAEEADLINFLFIFLFLCIHFPPNTVNSVNKKANKNNFAHLGKYFLNHRNHRLKPE